MSQVKTTEAALLRMYEQQHPTLREKRLQQILDEYLFLRDMMHQTPGANDTLVSLEEHLKQELVKNSVPIPAQVTQGVTTDVEELKASLVEETITNLRSVKDNVQAQQKELEKILQPLLATASGKAASVIINTSGLIPFLAKELLGEPPSRPVFYFLAVLSSFPACLEKLSEEIPPKKLVQNVSWHISNFQINFSLIMLSNYLTDGTHVSGEEIPPGREFFMKKFRNFLLIFSSVESLRQHQQFPRHELILKIKDLFKPIDRKYIVTISETTSNVISNALRCLINLCLNPDSRREISQNSEITSKMVVLMTCTQFPKVQINALWLLSNLPNPEFHNSDGLLLTIEILKSMNVAEEVLLIALRIIVNHAVFNVEGHHSKFKDKHVIDSLISLMNENPSLEVKEATLKAISQLLAKNNISDLKHSKDVLTFCVNFVHSEGQQNYSENVAVQALWCITHICRNKPELSEMVILGHGFTHLISFVTNNNNYAMLTPALWALAAISENEKSLGKFRELDSIKPLVSLLFSSDDLLIFPTNVILYNLSKDGKNKNLIQKVFVKLAMKDPMIKAKLLAQKM